MIEPIKQQQQVLGNGFQFGHVYNRRSLTFHAFGSPITLPGMSFSGFRDRIFFKPTRPPTMFTGGDFLHSRFFISESCPNVIMIFKKKNQDTCHRSFFCALSQVPSAARLVRPGRVAREWRIVARQVPVRNVYLDQQWWKGGEKKGPTKSGWKQIGDQNNATKTITNFDSEILSLEVFRFFCELEAFRFSPAVGSVSSMLFLLRAPRGTERWREICFTAIFVAFGCCV